MNDEKIKALKNKWHAVWANGQPSCVALDGAVDELAADHDAEVKRLKETIADKGGELVTWSNLAAGNGADALTLRDVITRLKTELEEQSECRRREHAGRCKALSELESVKERLAAADAFLHRYIDAENISQVEAIDTEVDAYLSPQSPASEALACGPCKRGDCPTHQIAGTRRMKNDETNFHPAGSGGFDREGELVEASPIPTSQPAPDVTAHELLNNRINALNVQLAEVRTVYVKLEARIKAIEPAFRTEVVPKAETRENPFFPAYRAAALADGKPVPEPPLVTDHEFMDYSQDRHGICCHSVGQHDVCGLPESHHVRSK